MDLVGTFPFGWVRNLKEDNWQIIWDSKSKSLVLKSSLSGKIVKFCSCENWQDAKTNADNIRCDHGLLKDII